MTIYGTFNREILTKYIIILYTLPISNIIIRIVKKKFNKKNYFFFPHKNILKIYHN